MVIIQEPVCYCLYLVKVFVVAGATVIGQRGAALKMGGSETPDLIVFWK